MAQPSPQLVLITGSTGHVGSATLLQLLGSGYTVRAAVRSEAKAAQILARPAIQALNLAPGRLNFTTVPDIAAPDAYDEAVRGATHVIHIASPLVTADTVPLARHEEYFIRPAVRGTLGMLEAALRAGTVERMVITSSIVSLIPVDEMEGTVPHRGPPVRPTDRPPFVEGPYTSEFAAYSASKTAALSQAEAWIARRLPRFDVVFLHPSFILGHNDAVATPAQALRGTNAVVLAMLLGKTFGPYAGATVHVDDVARAHVAALRRDIVPGGRSYILSGAARWNDAKEVARRSFPDAMESRALTSRGNVDTTEIEIDASLTESTFGFRLRSFEEQVVSTVGQFLDLRMQQKASGAAAARSGAMRVKEALLQVRANA